MWRRSSQNHQWLTGWSLKKKKKHLYNLKTSEQWKTKPKKKKLSMRWSWNILSEFWELTVCIHDVAGGSSKVYVHGIFPWEWRTAHPKQIIQNKTKTKKTLNQPHLSSSNVLLNTLTTLDQPLWLRILVFFFFFAKWSVALAANAQVEEMEADLFCPVFSFL